MPKKAHLARFSKYVIVCMVVTLLWVSNSFPPEESRVIFCDVGQGDAILVSKGTTQVLIDTGPNAAVLTCLEEAMPFWDKTLEFVVLTHPDLDHIGGFEYVSDFYKISSVLYLPIEPDTGIMASFYRRIAEMQEKGTHVLIPTRELVILAGNEMKMEVFNPFFPFSLVEECKKDISETQLWDKNGCFLPLNRVDKYGKNNLSIGIKLTIEGVTFLLTGDLEEKAELALQNSPLLHRVNVLKVGHHGAKTSTTPLFIEEIRPEISIFSVGKNNKYNHPSPQVLQQLEDIGSTVYRTDTQGTIIFMVKNGVLWRKNN